MKDGVPAFPTTSQNYDGHGVPCSDGMSLRDYFAAAKVSYKGFLPEDNHEYHEAVVGRPMPPEENVVERLVWCAEVVARVRYIFADAMLREREIDRG
jgi:hypothetical protein